MPSRAAALLTSNQRPRYLEPHAPVVFPEEAVVPESQLHLDLRTLLYRLLSDYLGEATVGSEQFVYFDAADPKQAVAPDVYVRLQPRGERIRTWKVWERGAPDVAVEIVSDSDAGESSWRQKLNAYRSIGVRELLRFDPEAPPTTRLRIWDRVDETLIERAVSLECAPSSVLPLTWVLAPAEDLEIALRILDETGQLFPCQAEARKAEAEARKAEAEARIAAEARVTLLEAELRRFNRTQ